uniref:apolipoprotein B receptor n=1 Tax=Jaculus jaculus TaxID=51337 RepID=UPI001E1B3C4C|nr:apolipoprotein B receptor [Jaculus jaculus]
MDFLRLHFPGLHQALRGALDSFSTFMSYLVGDAVPTVEKETQAAEELGEVAIGKPGGRSERVGGPREARRCQEGSLAGKQTWEWGAQSSPRSKAGQDTRAKEAAMAPLGQEANVPLDGGIRLEAGPETHGDRSSGAQESRELDEEEVSRGEPLSTWEQEEEEEEEVRATEPGIASGVESQLTWHSEEPEGKAGTGGQKVTEGSEWVTKDAAAETKGPGAIGAVREEERVLVMGGPSAKAQGTQGPGEESVDWETWGREEAQASSGKEADLPGVKETEHGPVLGESIPEASGRIWILEKTCRGDLEEEMGEKRKAEAKLETQTLETERIAEADESQTSEREAVGGQETGGCFEGEGRRDLAIRADETSLEQEMQAEKALRGKESGLWATEAMLALDKEAEGELDLEAAPEARHEELFLGERNEEAQIRQGLLEVKVSEGQEPELTGDPQTPTRQPEESQEEPGRIPDLSKEETLQNLKAYCRYMETSSVGVEACENWKRRESRNPQEGKTNAEAGEEGAALGQAVEAQAKGSQELELPVVPVWGTDEELASQAVNQELKGSQEAEVATGQSLGELEVRESRASEEEAAVPWEGDRTSRGGWRLEEAVLSLQVSEDMQSRSLNPDTGEDKAIPGIRTAREGPQQEAVLAWEGEFRRSWHSEGQVDAWRGTELEEVADGENRGETEVGETGEEEQAEVGGSALAGGSSKVGDVTSGSQAVRTEGATVTEETEGLLEEQMALEEAARGELVRKAQTLQDVENVTSEGQRTEIQETDPEGLEDIPGQERQPTPQIPAEVLLGPSETAERAGNATGDAHSSWSEALLPGSLLDVSAPRSRVLLSRSSSQRRRSRPSFHRTPVPEQQSNSPSPQPQEELSAPEQSLLQPEEVPEPSTPRPGGTPVPARRRPPGHGFGLAHPGMMQELQARLGQPKPQ